MLLRLLRNFRRTRAPAQSTLAEADTSLLAEGRQAEAAGHLDVAIACYREHAAMHPGDLQSRIALVNALHDAWRIEECLDACREALQVAPRNPLLYSGYLLFSHYDANLQADELWNLHRRYGEFFPKDLTHGSRALAAGERVRIGYVSRDFHAHAVGYFIEAVLAHHDRSCFQVFCYHTNSTADENTARFAGYVEGWRQVEDDTPQALAERIRADRLDVLVDLGGHTKANRLPVFALKPAPIQVTWLGYPNTTGLTQMDYRISDDIADPEGDADARHSERLLRLERPFLCYTPRASPPVIPRDSGAAAVFGCFNMTVKVNEPLLDDWATILHAVPGSRLVLKSLMLDRRDTAKRLAEALEARGLGADRWTMSGWSATSHEHMAAYGDVDIALDTFPYNGTTTTCEALWMGVPVVSLAGDSHVARVGATLLDSVGLRDLVGDTRAQYVDTAIELARDPDRRRHLRSTLRTRMSDSPLMDGPGFAHRFEQAILQACRRPGAADQERSAD